MGSITLGFINWVDNVNWPHFAKSASYAVDDIG